MNRVGYIDRIAGRIHTEAMTSDRDRFKKRDVDYRVAPDMPTLPRQYYQSEEIYREELEKIFYRRWLFACREEEMRTVGMDKYRGETPSENAVRGEHKVKERTEYIPKVSFKNVVATALV